MRHISFLGRFLNGKPVGTVWLGLIGNGFLTGDADVKNPGKISSENAAYIYPGYEMALVGKFQENFMLSGTTHIFRNLLFLSCVFLVSSHVSSLIDLNKQ